MNGITFKARARRHRHTPGEMNKTEERYADELELRKRAGEIHDWKFEALKFKLAKATFYTPDFLVVHNNGLIEMIEVKGHWEDDARVKIKVAAKLFGIFKFTAVKPLAKKHGGGWQSEDF